MNLLPALLDLARQARLATAESEVLGAAASFLLHSFQAGRVEIRLIGDAPGILATRTAGGSITLVPLPAAIGELSDLAAESLDSSNPADTAARGASTQEATFTMLSAQLQDEGEPLGSVQITEPRAAAHFTAAQRALLPLLGQHIAMLLRDWRQRDHIADLAVADERSRLARELHDTVAQSLVALVLRLERIAEPRGDLAEARQLARRALEDVRRAIWGLRPALLEALPFHEALAREVERMADAAHLSSRVTVVGQPRLLRQQQEMVLFRVAQEALSNAIRHAAARRVRASLTYLNDGVRLVIEDDGRGFDPAVLAAPGPSTTAPRWPPYFDDPPSTAGEAGHFGLQSMRERARLVGGWLTLESAPGQGTKISVYLPYTPLPDLLPPAALSAQAASSPVPSVSSGRIRILVADDQAVIRAGMRRLLEDYPDFEVVGEAADGLEALAEAQDLGPQVILMDMRMPGMNGLEALRQLRASNPDLRVLMLSAFEHDEDVLESLKAGASGYILKDIAPDELAQAIRAVAQGETLLAPGLTGKLVDRLDKPPQENPASLLTTREREVLRALAGGLRNKEIARQLQVSERTVTFHLAHVYQKLGVNSRTEALSRALELDLLKP